MTNSEKETSCDMPMARLVGVYGIPTSREVLCSDIDTLFYRREFLTALQSSVVAEIYFPANCVNETEINGDFAYQFKQEGSNPIRSNVFDFCFLDSEGKAALSDQGEVPSDFGGHNFRLLVYLRDFQPGKPIDSPVGSICTTAAKPFPQRLTGLWIEPDNPYYSSCEVFHLREDWLDLRLKELKSELRMELISDEVFQKQEAKIQEAFSLLRRINTSRHRR